MEQLVNRASNISDLAFLRILQMVHQQTSLLVDDLKAYELPIVTPRSPSDSAELNLTLSNSASSSAATTVTAATVTTMLETSMEELFIPYTESQKYLERESKSLGSLYASYLAAFTRYHVSLPTVLHCSD